MNNREGLSEDFNSLSQSPEILERSFLYRQKTISYTNRTQIKQNQDRGVGYLKVRNILCRKENNRLIKITQILFQDRTISITDVLSPGSNNLSKRKLKMQKSKKKGSLQFLADKSEGFMVTEPQLAKSNSIHLSKRYRNILKMYISWVNCFQNLTTQKYIMQTITQNFQQYSIEFLQAMKQKPLIVDSFRKFINNNAQNLENISKQNGKQNYLVGTKRLVNFFKQQQKVHYQSTSIQNQPSMKDLQNRGPSSIFSLNSSECYIEKKEGEQLALGSDPQKTNYFIS